MKEFVIITDSGSDLSSQQIAELGIDMIDLGAELDGEAVNVKDASGLKAFYDGMRQKKNTKTYAANAESFTGAFEKHLEAGKDILYIGFSGGLSGTYGASLIAKADLMEKYPEARVECVDTKCASLGEGLAVWYAAQMQKQGASLDEVLADLVVRAPKISHRFTVDDLVYLKRGGRISAATALIGSMLSIKPTLHVDDAGKLVSVGKVRGRKNAIVSLYEDMKRLAVNPSENVVFISHADCLGDAEALANMIRDGLAPKDIVIGDIGPVIGAHSGPGTLALFFMGTER